MIVICTKEDQNIKLPLIDCRINNISIGISNLGLAFIIALRMIQKIANQPTPVRFAGSSYKQK